MIIGIDAGPANREHKSGTEWYSYYLIRWLAKLDQKNEYILYTNKPLQGGLLNLATKSHDSVLDVDVEIKFDKNGYQILKSPFNNFKARILNWPFKYFWTQGRLSLEMLIRRPDILFVPAHTLPIIHPKKSVVTIHDVAFERQEILYQKEQMGPEDKKARRILNILVNIFTQGKYRANSIDYLRWSTQYAVSKASKIISVSNFTKQDLVELYGADTDKIQVIYNGYNKDLYNKLIDNNITSKILVKYGIEPPYFLYVGRIEKKKNIPALIEAFAIMREQHKNIKHKLVLVGDASFGYDETKYQIREYDLVNDIIMPGWVEENDLPHVFNAASAFVFPSHYEGFGIPILQAMAVGVPVIASEQSSLPEIGGNAALYFDPKDSYTIAYALAQVIDNQKLHDQLIIKGYEQSIKYGWKKTAEETIKLLNLL